MQFTCITFANLYPDIHIQATCSHPDADPKQVVIKAEVQKESCLLTAGNSFVVLWWVSGTSTFYIFRTLLTANPSIMSMSCTWILTLIAVSLASFFSRLRVWRSFLVSSDSVCLAMRCPSKEKWEGWELIFLIVRLSDAAHDWLTSFNALVQVFFHQALGNGHPAVRYKMLLPNAKAVTISLRQVGEAGLGPKIYSSSTPDLIFLEVFKQLLFLLNAWVFVLQISTRTSRDAGVLLLS